MSDLFCKVGQQTFSQQTFSQQTFSQQTFSQQTSSQQIFGQQTTYIFYIEFAIWTSFHSQLDIFPNNEFINLCNL